MCSDSPQRQLLEEIICNFFGPGKCKVVIRKVEKNICFFEAYGMGEAALRFRLRMPKTEEIETVYRKRNTLFSTTLKNPQFPFPLLQEGWEGETEKHAIPYLEEKLIYIANLMKMEFWCEFEDVIATITLLNGGKYHIVARNKRDQNQAIEIYLPSDLAVKEYLNCSFYTVRNAYERFSLIFSIPNVT